MAEKHDPYTCANCGHEPHCDGVPCHHENCECDSCDCIHCGESEGE